MNLQDFFEVAEITRKEFCDRVGITESTLHYYLKGEREPSLATAIKIVQETMGVVKLEDLIRTK